MSGVQGSGVQGGEELPPGDAAVADGEPISIRNVNGLDSHNGTAVVSGDPPVIQGINLPAGTAMVDAGDTVSITRADGGGAPFSTAAIARIVNGLLSSISIPVTEALLVNGQGTLNIEQFDNSGSFAGTARVANNVLTMQLANATTRTVVNALPITIRAANNKTAGATVAIDQGALQNFPLANATDAILSNGDALEIENQGQTQGVSGTVVVAAGVAKARLPVNTAMIADAVAIQVSVTGVYVDTITPQVNAAGAITGFILS